MVVAIIMAILHKTNRINVMREELENCRDFPAVPFICTAGTILKFFAELLAVVGIVVGVAVFSSDTGMGILCLIGGILLTVVI